jgi:hypothetical protein
VFRTLYETESEQLLDEGKITQQDKVAINKINGHNSITVKQHYLKHNIKSYVNKARGVLESFMCPSIQSDNNKMDNINDIVSDEYYPSYDEPVVIKK